MFDSQKRDELGFWRFVQVNGTEKDNSSGGLSGFDYGAGDKELGLGRGQQHDRSGAFWVVNYRTLLRGARGWGGDVIVLVDDVAGTMYGWDGMFGNRVSQQIMMMSWVFADTFAHEGAEGVEGVVVPLRTSDAERLGVKR